MEATKQKRTFKEKAQATGQKVKQYGRKYKDDIRFAYDTGYKKGWDDAYVVPKRFGAKTAAAFGYKKGLRNRRRSDKYVNQYQRGGNK